MVKPKTVGNSWTENALRGTGVAVRRESVRLLKELSLDKRKIEQTRRVLDKQQRALRVLMGRDAYPGAGINHTQCKYEALNEFHPPGFCYKKNGEPKTPKSIHESGTRKILPLDVTPGRIKVQGTPAVNVICSDSTSLGEALSKKGETLALLSEIRNTSAILQNPKILLDAWDDTEEDEDPKAFMKQYRKSLLRRLFSILEGCEEVNDILQKKSKSSSTPDYQGEYDELDMIPAQLSEHTFMSSRKSQQSMMEVNSDPTQILFKQNPEEFVQADKSVGGLVKKSEGILLRNKTNNMLGPSSKHVSFSKSKKGQKSILQGIIKKLVNKIRLMDQMGQGLLEYKRKRPYVNSDHLWGPLIKLLERQSLFSSLTDSEKSREDEEEGGSSSLTSRLPMKLSSGEVNHILSPAKERPADDIVRTRRSLRCEACRQRVLSPLKKTPSYPASNVAARRKSTKFLFEPEEEYPDPNQSWTLSVSRMDLVRLHHELHTDMVSSRMAAIASSSFLLPLESLGE